MKPFAVIAPHQVRKGYTYKQPGLTQLPMVKQAEKGVQIPSHHLVLPVKAGGI